MNSDGFYLAALLVSIVVIVWACLTKAWMEAVLGAGLAFVCLGLLKVFT